MKLVSVITISYNNAAGLEKTIDSVMEQDGPFEMIVIDGGSSDGSRGVIERYKSRLAYAVSEKDNGIYHAQNKGIEKAKGDYCLFLNSGDVLADKQVLKKAAANDGCDIIYGDLITIDKNNIKVKLSSPGKMNSYQLIVSTLWHPCAFISRELFEKAGKYNERFGIAGDYEFFVRSILKHGASACHIDLPVTIFDMSGISNSPEHEQIQIRERKLAWELNFSKVVTETLETRVKILRSREYKMGRLLTRLFGGLLK